LEITSTIGIASNKICAQTAAKTSLPNSIFYVDRGQEKFFLHNKPLTYLPTIGPRTAKYLNALSINNIGDLAKQPLSWVIHTFGENGNLLWHLANGRDKRKLNAPYQQKSISKSSSFSFPTNDYYYLVNEVYNLSTQIWQNMKTKSKKSNTIGIRIVDQHGRTRTKQEKFYQNFESVTEINQAAKKMLALLLNHNTQIQTISVFLFNIQNAGSQNKLFDNSFHKLKEIRQSLLKLSRDFGLSDQQNYATI